MWQRVSESRPPQRKWVLLKAAWRKHDQWAPFVVAQASGDWWLDEFRQTKARINPDDHWCLVGPQ